MNQIRYNIRMLNLTSYVYDIQMLNSTSNSSSNEEVPEEIYVFLGVYLSVVCFVGILGNSTALIVFFRHAHLRTRINVFIIALLINDLIMCVFGIPLSAASNFHGYFVWDFSVCVFQGFIMFFGSMSSMYILSAISLSRYIVITRQMSAVVVNNTVSATMLAFCYIVGLFWSAIPFSGWTRYEYEAIGTTCSVALDSSDFYVLSYNICIFVFCYLVPVITMICCYCKILHTVSCLFLFFLFRFTFSVFLSFNLNLSVPDKLPMLVYITFSQFLIHQIIIIIITISFIIIVP